MIIKLMLICLSNSFFNFFIKMKSEKRTVFRFPFFYENEKRMKLLKIQRKNLLNVKMVVIYLNFVFFIEVKAKSKYRILNSVFQFIKNTKWHFCYTDSILMNLIYCKNMGLTLGFIMKYTLREEIFAEEIFEEFSFVICDLNCQIKFCKGFFHNQFLP